MIFRMSNVANEARADERGDFSREEDEQEEFINLPAATPTATICFQRSDIPPPKNNPLGISS